MARVDVAGGGNGVAVDGDGVLDALGVAAGISDHDRDAAFVSSAEDELIAEFEAIDGEIESAELVFFIRVGPGHVADQVRLELAESAGERAVEMGEIFGVGGVVAKVYVDG